MAHKTRLDIWCDWRNCSSRASWEVWDESSRYYGVYCKRHAEAKVKEVNQIEMDLRLACELFGRQDVSSE